MQGKVENMLGVFQGLYIYCIEKTPNPSSLYDEHRKEGGRPLRSRCRSLTNAARLTHIEKKVLNRFSISTLSAAIASSKVLQNSVSNK